MVKTNHIAIRYAQRRPGHAPRRHREIRMRSSAGSALNEGRGTHPGDTQRRHRDPVHTPAAQRRPGHAPRRHLPPPQQPHPRRSARSTKAGARTPATRPEARRPARRPSRSTKAGARTPATRAGRQRHGGNLDRSTKAGARTPATPRQQPVVYRTRLSLNEGRGTHPGDTTGRRTPCAHFGFAQRRPGHAPRRHGSRDAA